MLSQLQKHSAMRTLATDGPRSVCVDRSRCYYYLRYYRAKGHGLNELASECESPEEFMDLLQFFRSVANSFPASR